MSQKISNAVILLLIASLIVVLARDFDNKFAHPSPHLSTVSPAANCRIVQHEMGETCVPNNPKRVVTISQFTLGNALALGVQPVGSTTFISADVSRDQLFPQYLSGRTENIKPIGGQFQPGLEEILLLKPDLIVGWEQVKGVYPLLAEIAPTVLGDWRGIQKSWQNHFDFMAEVLGKKEAGQKIWNRYYQRIQDLKIALGDRYQNDEISVAYIGTDGIVSYVKNSFDGFILNNAGLKRPKAQDVESDYGRIDNISEEELEQIDGDILFVMTGDIKKNQLLQKIQKKPLWNQLRAVQQNRIYFVDASTWLGGTLLAADAIIDDLYKYLVDMR